MLAKSQLNRIVVLISKALIDSNISHEEYVLMNNVLIEFYDMKEEIKNCKALVIGLFLGIRFFYSTNSESLATLCLSGGPILCEFS